MSPKTENYLHAVPSFRNSANSPPRHAQLHLPVIDPDEALRFVALLERISAAIWRAHGQQMGERLIDGYLGRENTMDRNHSLLADDDLPF